MIFCGQCGLQLPPGSTRCRRCGATVEPADMPGSGDLHVDDATVASRAFIVQDQRPPQTPNSQQPLILRRNSGYDNGMQDPGGATSRVEQVNYNGQLPPTQQVMGNSYGAYPPQPTGGYAPLQSGGGYPVQHTGGYPPQISHPGYSNPAYQQPGVPYTDVPPHMVSGYQQYPTRYPVEQRASNAKGRTTGLILVFIGLLLILSAAVLFAMQQGLIKGIKTGTGYSENSSAVAIIARQHRAAAPQHYSYSSQQSQLRIVVTVHAPGATPA
ncbi:MAG: hypothetical protein NVS2B12_02330 [Ktedonobacteraceae bacterium]